MQLEEALVSHWMKPLTCQKIKFSWFIFQPSSANLSPIVRSSYSARSSFVALLVAAACSFTLMKNSICRFSVWAELLQATLTWLSLRGNSASQNTYFVTELMLFVVLGIFPKTNSIILSSVAEGRATSSGGTSAAVLATCSAANTS